MTKISLDTKKGCINLVLWVFLSNSKIISIIIFKLVLKRYKYVSALKSLNIVLFTTPVRFLY